MQLYERQFQVPVCMYVHVYVHAARHDSSRARTDPQTLHIFSRHRSEKQSIRCHQPAPYSMYILSPQNFWYNFWKDRDF